MSLVGIPNCSDPSSSGKNDFDVVILNGRVIDPESNLDAIRNIGIRDGSVRLITTKEIKGRLKSTLRTWWLLQVSLICTSMDRIMKTTHTK